MLEYNYDEQRVESPKNCISQEAMNYLYEMKQNDMLCDAKITVKDGAFKIHRNILCSCSDYFRALFTTPLTDEKDSVIIPGIRAVIMEKIIDYAYLRKCKMEEDTIFDLFIASDYLLMIGLVNQCVDFLENILRPDNCIGIMLFARNFTYDLKLKAREYIMKNFVDISTQSQEILQIKLNDFYDIISDNMLNTQREEPVWECCIKWIDFDRHNRQQFITQLMRGVRLGLLSTRFFMEQVKDHPYVINCDEAKPLIIETLTFLYDLDMIASKDGEIRTPAIALPRIPHEVLFAIGGWSEGLPQRCIETYDTRADRWIRIFAEDSATPRAYHGTAVIGHKIYCIGGFDGMEYFNTCRVFDAITKLWKEIAPMHCRRCYVSVAELNGFIYAMGGYDGQTRQSSAERYDPKTNQWTMIASMNVQRSDASACTLNGKIYITGGFNGQECMSSAEFYDPETSIWTPIPNMISRRSGVSCVAYKGLIYVVGGFNGLSRMNTGERFDPETQTWSSIREMYHPRSNFGLEIIDDMIFAIGGFNGVATISHAECYVVEQDEWLEATDMSMVRSALSVNVVKNLSNVRDYIHPDRERLMEERRQRMFPNDVEMQDQDNNNNNLNNNNNNVNNNNNINNNINNNNININNINNNLNNNNNNNINVNNNIINNINNINNNVANLNNNNRNIMENEDQQPVNAVIVGNNLNRHAAIVRNNNINNNINNINNHNVGRQGNAPRGREGRRRN